MVLDGRSVSLFATALNLLLFSLRCKNMLRWSGYSVLSWQKVGGKALAGTWEVVIQHYQTGFSSDFLEPAATVSSSRLALNYDLNYFSVLKVAAFLRLAFMVVGQPQSPVFCSSVRRATLCKKCLPSPVFAKWIKVTTPVKEGSFSAGKKIKPFYPQYMFDFKPTQVKFTFTVVQTNKNI